MYFAASLHAPLTLTVDRYEDARCDFLVFRNFTIYVPILLEHGAVWLVNWLSIFLNKVVVSSSKFEIFNNSKFSIRCLYLDSTEQVSGCHLHECVILIEHPRNNVLFLVTEYGRSPFESKVL